MFNGGGQSLEPSAAKPVGPPRRRREIVNSHTFTIYNFLRDELSDAITRGYHKVSLAIIDEKHSDLTAVIGIDNSGSDGEPVLESET